MSNKKVEIQEDRNIWIKHGISIGKAMEEEGVRERQEIEEYQQGNFPLSPTINDHDY